MRSTLPFIVILITFITSSCNAQFKLPESIDDVKDMVNGKEELSEQDVIAGLKEALSVGTNKSTEMASKVDGYYKNPAIFIPFPPEAEKVESTVRSLGMGSLVDDFVQSLNRAAEEAAKEATPIFLGAIKDMTVKDGWGILRGGDHAATEYLQEKTTDELYVKFKPIVEDAIEKVEVTKYWEPIITRYNKVPFVKKQNPDLEDYTTKKAIEGLFYLVSKEEEKIRKNPGARVTDLLKKVFGRQD